MSIQIEEQGRRLRVMVGGEEEFIIPPISARAGGRLLTGFLNIMGDLFGGEGDADGLTVDFVLLALGSPIYADATAPTARELQAKTYADELYERMQELRFEEQYELTQAVFFWQSQGGIAAARIFVEEGDYPKALNLLFEKAGLEMLPIPTSTGSSSELTTSPTGEPGTSTPEPSGTLSKHPLPPHKQGYNQNQQ